jgi:hypothetical protein
MTILPALFSRTLTLTTALSLTFAVGCPAVDASEATDADDEESADDAEAPVVGDDEGPALERAPGPILDRPDAPGGGVFSPPDAASHPIEQFADARIVGVDSTQFVGTHVTAGADLNGDGLPDVLTSTIYGPDAVEQAATWAFESPVVGVVDIHTADGKLMPGPRPGGGFYATSFEGIGDADGDGYGEVVLSDSSGSVWTDYTDALVIFEGPIVGTLTEANADALILHEVEGSTDLSVLANAGDINGDGLTDLLGGDPYYASPLDPQGARRGAVWLLLSPLSENESTADARAMIVGDGASWEAGRGLAGAGDVDGDGLDDILIGAPRVADADGLPSQGRAFLFTSNVEGTIDVGHADAIVMGDVPAGRLGWDVNGAGDVNDDGYDDVLLGAASGSTYGHPGAAYLMSGPLSGILGVSDATATIRGVAAGDAIGTSVDGAGDVDGDGVADIVISGLNGAGGPEDGGVVGVYLGPLAGTQRHDDAHLQLHGSDVSGRFGNDVIGAGDLDGDGLDDLVLGSYREDVGAAHEAGATYIIYGVDGGW